MDWFMLHPENKHEKLECPEVFLERFVKPLNCFNDALIQQLFQVYYSFITAMF